MNGENTKITFMFVIPVVLILLLSVVTPGLVRAEDVNIEDTDYTARAPIRIDGNDDFAAQAADEGWPGDGSEEDPYMIEGYEINGTGYGYGIYVGNTTVHFVVRGCYVHNVSGTRDFPYYLNAGIHFYTVQNGNIINNVISDSEEEGIHFRMAEKNIISDNYITNNPQGINLGFSHKNVITRNTIRSDTPFSMGISLGRSDDNIINNNTISNHRYGIYEDTCDRNLIEDNIFIDNEWDFESIYAENGHPIDDGSPPYAFFILLILVVVSIVIVAIVMSKKAEKERRKNEIERYETNKEGYKER